VRPRQPGVRLVGRRLRRSTRAAAQEPLAVAGEARLRGWQGHERALVVERVAASLERDPGVAAVGVVVRARRAAEAVDLATEEVGRVGAQLVEDRQSEL